MRRRRDPRAVFAPPMIRTCPHGLVVCACSPPAPAPSDPWLGSAETIAFYPKQVRR